MHIFYRCLGLGISTFFLVGCRPTTAADEAEADAAAESDSNDSQAPDFGDETPGDDSGPDTGESESEGDSTESTGDEGDLPDELCDTSDVPPIEEVVWQGDPPFPEQEWGASFLAGAVSQDGEIGVFADATGDDAPLESDRVRIFSVELETGTLVWEEYDRGASWQSGPIRLQALDGGDVYIVDRIGDRQLSVTRAAGTSRIWTQALTPLDQLNGAGSVQSIDIAEADAQKFRLGGTLVADGGGPDGSARTFLQEYAEQSPTPVAELYEPKAEAGRTLSYELWEDSFTFTLRNDGTNLVREFSLDGAEVWADQGDGTRIASASLDGSMVWRGMDIDGNQVDSVFGVYRDDEPGLAEEVYRESRCGFYLGSVVPVGGDRLIFVSSEGVVGVDDPRETIFALYDIESRELLDRRRLTTPGILGPSHVVLDGLSPELLVSVRQADDFNLHSYLMRIRPFD